MLSALSIISIESNILVKINIEDLIRRAKFTNYEYRKNYILNYFYQNKYLLMLLFYYLETNRFKK